MGKRTHSTVSKTSTIDTIESDRDSIAYQYDEAKKGMYFFIDTLDSTETFHEVLENILANKSSLRTLELTRSVPTSFAKASPAVKYRNLSEVKKLFAAVQECEQLEKLEMWNFGAFASQPKWDEEVVALSKMLSKLVNLTSIKLSFAKGAIPESVLQALGSLPNLKKVTLLLNESSNLAKLMGKSESLEELYIERNPGASESTKKSKATLIDDTREYFQYSMGHGMGIIQSLKTAKKLVTLDLGKGIGLSSFCAKLLADTLSESCKQTALKKLYFHYDSSPFVSLFDDDDEEEDDAAAAKQKALAMKQKQIEVNNRLFMAFVKVAEKNTTLQSLRNHAGDKIEGITDESIAALTTVVRIRNNMIPESDDNSISVPAQLSPPLKEFLFFHEEPQTNLCVCGMTA